MDDLERRYGKDSLRVVSDDGWFRVDRQQDGQWIEAGHWFLALPQCATQLIWS